jgi:hypothetical protein
MSDDLPEDEDNELYLDPTDPTTIGGLRRLVWEMDQIHAAAGSFPGGKNGRYTRVTRRAANGRYVAMVQAPGYKDFESYLDLEFGLHVTVAAIDEVTRRLVKVLKRRIREVELLTLVEAVRVLTSASAPREVEQAEDPNAVERLLAAELRRQGKAIPAALVEYMIGRESATAEEIAEKVHGDSLISEDAIGTNCRRTSGAAEPLVSPLRYRYCGGHVFKELLI